MLPRKDGRIRLLKLSCAIGAPIQYNILGEARVMAVIAGEEEIEAAGRVGERLAREV